MILCLDPLFLLLYITPLSWGGNADRSLNENNATKMPRIGTKMFLIMHSDKNVTQNGSATNRAYIKHENLMQQLPKALNAKLLENHNDNGTNVDGNSKKSGLHNKTVNGKFRTANSRSRLDFAKHSAQSSCRSGEWPSFVRIPKAMITGVPTIVSTMDVSQCSEHCKNNSEPTSSAVRPCQGFNFQDTSTPTCEFFDAQARLGPLNRNVGQRSFYYDKICLNDEFEKCRQRSYAFESFPDAQLSNSALKQLSASDNLACLSACLHEATFVCHSVNYIKDKNTCELNGHSRRTRFHDFQIDVQGVDYYENNCLTRKTRCASGDVYFVKTINSEIQPLDVAESLTSLHTCLQKCLDSDFIFCRSVEFDRSANECLISDEDSYSAPDILPLANSLGVDLFEPVCLSKTSATHLQCKRPYLFERYVNSALNIPESYRAMTGVVIEDCLITCTTDARCKSINYHRSNKVCMLSDSDRSNSSVSIVESSETDYYENNCNKVSEAHGCLFSLEVQGHVFRVEFRVAELETPTLTECLKSCVDADAEGGQCGAVAYGAKTRMCFHSELAMNAAVQAQKIEPNADYDIIVREDCYLKGDDRMGSAFVANVGDNNIDNNNATNSDKMLLIHTNLTEFHSETSESLVERLQALSSSVACSFRLELSNRALRPLYRNDQLRADSVASCHLMCQTATSYECRSFSYSNSSRFCHLSDTEPDTLPVKLLTQVDLGAEYFVRDRCTHQPRVALQQQELPDVLPIPQGSRLSAGAMAADSAEVTENGNQQSAFTVTPPIFYGGTGGSGSSSNGNISAISGGTTTTASFALSASTDVSAASSGRPPTGVTALPSFSGNGRLSGSDKIAAGTGIPVESASQTPVRGTQSTLSPQNVQVSAICSNDGVNVTVTSSQPYTGAVYAAERFSFCRNLVTTQNSFWLFLPRPNVNSACNTILVNDQMSGVVVISNDNIIPYDVTTKDDLFYQITCDFSTVPTGGGKVVVTSGIVVGGPTPRVIAAAGVSSNYEANLRILRSGSPVKNVLIGEQLMLSIESTSDASRMEALNCNVTRIGGSGPVPEPLTVIDNGCPIVPQVIGTIQKGGKGLEASLTAFRIDGSAEIQIVCLVMFCPQECPPSQCKSSDGSTFQSFGRKKRKSDMTLEDPETETILESVNGRLRVFVEGEDGAPSKEEMLRKSVESVTLGCIPEMTFVAVTAVLGILLLLLLTAFACLICRRSWMSAIQQKLLNEHVNGSRLGGSRYTDTMTTNRTATTRVSKRLRADLLGTSQL